MWQQSFCATFERVINYALKIGACDQSILSKLNEKSFHIILSDVSMPFIMHVSNNKILVSSIIAEHDCKLTTSLSTLRKVQAGSSLTELIKKDQLDIDGDIKVAQQFAALFESIDIDIASEIAKYIGDIPTHKLSQLNNNLSNKVKFAKTQIEADATEWLVHEKKWLVSECEISQFSREVSDISNELEALASRIKQLAQ